MGTTLSQKEKPQLPFHSNFFSDKQEEKDLTYIFQHRAGLGRSSAGVSRYAQRVAGVVEAWQVKG